MANTDNITFRVYTPSGRWFQGGNDGDIYVDMPKFELNQLMRTEIIENGELIAGIQWITKPNEEPRIPHTFEQSNGQGTTYIVVNCQKETQAGLVEVYYNESSIIVQWYMYRGHRNIRKLYVIKTSTYDERAISELEDMIAYREKQLVELPEKIEKEKKQVAELRAKIAKLD